MVQGNKVVVIFATLVVAAILQLVFIAADGMDSPVKAAVEFSKDYFLLKDSMADRLCSKLNSEDSGNLVKDVIFSARQEAHARGFELGMERKSLTHIETEIISRDAQTARIKLSAVSRTCINPLFAWVASLFKLGETHEVEAVLSLVKENGAWKVCGNPFGMAGAKV